jgi:MFS family permease
MLSIGLAADRTERFLLPASFITCLGDSIQLTAAALLVLQSERNALAVGWLFIFVAIPQVVLSFIFGRAVDRFDRRLLCVACDLTGAAAALVLPVWLLLGGPVSIGAYVSNFALAIVAALFTPASSALIRERIRPERLGPFNANFEMATQAGTLLSTAVGGFLIQSFGVKPFFFFNAASFLASAILTLAIGRQRVPAGVEQDSTEATGAVAADRPPVVWLGLLYALGSLVTTVWNTIIVVLVIEAFRQGAGTLGVVDALAGVGLLLAAAAYKWISPRVGDLRLALAGYLSCAGLVALQPLTMLGALICVPLAALTFGLGRVAARTLLMSAVPSSRAGRVFGATNAFGLALSVVGTLAISSVVDRTDVRNGFLMLGVLVGISASIIVGMLHRVRLDRQTAVRTLPLDSCPAASALQGTLKASELAPVLSLLAELKSTGIMSIKNEPLQGTLCLEHGRIVGATFGAECGKDSLEALALTMVEQSWFTFTEASVDGLRNLSMSPECVALHLNDLIRECRQLANRIPSLKAVPRPVLRESPASGRLTLDRGAVRVLMLADGRRTVADLVSISRAATTFRHLGQLVELELAEFRPSHNGHDPQTYLNGIDAPARVMVE